MLSLLVAESSSWLLLAPLLGICIYFSLIGAIVLCRPSLFAGRFGRSHRLTGAAYLVTLVAGVADLVCVAALGREPLFAPLMFDCALGVAGIALTLTAASDFRVAHAKVENIASGALHETATVSVPEMIEHAFYQGLNLAQIMFLHYAGGVESLRVRLALLAAVTGVWTVRGFFPVNAFSANYTKSGTDAASIEGVLYRLKKYQYLLYKHFLLHGLNASVAVAGLAIAERPWFRLYWLSLNTAYVMEFFMQTLVRRRVLAQRRMLALNQFLMLVSTAAALPVLACVHVAPAALSLALNLVRRRCELSNMAAVVALLLLLTHGAPEHVPFLY